MGKKSIVVAAVALAVGIGLGLLAAPNDEPRDDRVPEALDGRERQSPVEPDGKGPRLQGPDSLEGLDPDALKEEVRRLRAENAALLARLDQLQQDSAGRDASRPPDTDVVAAVEEREDANLEDAGLVRCLVCDREGRPRAGVEIGLWRKPREGHEARSWSPRATDEDGRAEFEDLLPGVYQIDLLRPQGKWMRSLEVKAGYVSEARFWVWGEAAGRVHGRVVRYGGEPARGAVVSLGYVGGAYASYRTKVDEAGRYGFESLPPGRRTIRASLGAERLNVEHRIEIPAHGAVEHDFVLGVPMLHGVLTDAESGRPVEGVRLTLQRRNRPQGTKISDAEGRYAFVDVDAGTYVLWISRDGYGSGFREDVRVDPEGSRLDIALRPAAVLVLRVRRADGRPYTGELHLYMRPAGDGIGDYGSATVSVDEAGNAVHRRMVPGTYRLDMSADTTYAAPTTAREKASLDLELRPGQNEVEVQLQKD